MQNPLFPFGLPLKGRRIGSFMFLSIFQEAHPPIAAVGQHGSLFQPGELFGWPLLSRTLDSSALMFW